MTSYLAYADALLDRSRTSIRLLESLNREEDDEVAFEFHCIDINSCPPYTALSYAWGTERRAARIEINDHDFPIRENLWHAFHWLRELKNELLCGFFWIDALCIDQSINMERNHQVSLMKQIFSNVSEE
jgi:hypothetical protein